MDATKQEKIRKIHSDFKKKLNGILDRKKIPATHLQKENGRSKNKGD